MIIGVDIDNTIKDTHRAAVEIYNRKLNQQVKVEDVQDFYLDKAYGLTPKEGQKLWRSLEEEIYQLGVPLNHAVEVLNDLADQGHQIYFITARPDLKNIESVTRKWLKEHGFPYNGKNLIMNSQDKGKVSKELGVELFFEDAPDHLEKLVKSQVPTVIVDAVYNRDFPVPLKRITNWRQVYSLVEEMERSKQKKDTDQP
ncbi:HAD hydrolase-like protein [Thermoactinomyces intermedius]|uniref:Nucleotidase n=1 Tax=Thermoactinomyces intermedius TaxID=2024 RepID=A0A8I1A9N3_THEIN|nr:HAD hydrolase-like protein [Thermoactinomyces intermedius]MBA4547867.1 HAD hydrolase-like protein [Thermoactinomyces intermedius]MBA4836522.1 HAD hydrolase-like protein [Thermoactinomyces intermedius]MBH8593902.1 HAD hydrolase-like protein [Thermoactinomyces intermedius]